MEWWQEGLKDLALLGFGALIASRSGSKASREERDYQRQVTADERAHADARDALAGELELERTILEATRTYVVDIVTADLFARQGNWAKASKVMSKAGANPLNVATAPDLSLIYDKALHDRFMAALLDSQEAYLAQRRGEDTRQDPPTQIALATLAADLATLLRSQELRIARRERPLRRVPDAEDSARDAAQAAKLSEHIGELFDRKP